MRRAPALVGVAQVAQRAIPQRVIFFLTAAGLGRKFCVRALQVVYLCRPGNKVGVSEPSKQQKQVLFSYHFQSPITHLTLVQPFLRSVVPITSTVDSAGETPC